MLSIATVHRGSQREQYYEREIADDRELYYAGEPRSPGRGEGEPLGRWTGRGAAALGLSGDVEVGALREMWEGKVPGSGEQLRRMPAEGAVSALDLTFRPPKSVSVIFALADPDTRRAVAGAHDAAVDEALRYLERNACFVRRGHAGAVRERGEGFLVAAFQHHSSRAGDPLLHTHAVAANMAQGPDGRWTALDGRALFGQAKTAGYLYQAALRARLSEEVGVEWGPVREGTAEVMGVPREVLTHFSRRRMQILEAMAVEGAKSARAAQLATIRTRRAKQDVDPGRQREEWRARAVEFGFGREQVRALLGRARETSVPSRAELSREGDRMAGADGLTRRQSTFDRRDVLRHWAAHHRAGASVERIEALADGWLRSGSVWKVEPGKLTRETVIRRGDGKVAPAYFGARYSTQDMVNVERELLEVAAARRGEGAGVASEAAVTSALVRRPALREEQAEMVRALCRSGDGVQVVLGRAGTGKTYALAATREAWEQSGVPVYGTALSAAAARVLESQTGIPSRTVAQLRAEIEQWGGLDGAMAGGVLVVDEAAMVSTRDLKRLVDAATEQDVAVKVIGDDGQLPEIDAGGALRGLAQREGAIELREVRRQRDPDVRVALENLRSGDGERFLAGALARGAVTVVQSPEAQRTVAVEGWWADVQEHGHEQTALLAARHSDRRELNVLARERMCEHGRLGDRELEVGETEFAVGDRVVALRNRRSIGLLNADRGTIQVIDDDGGLRVKLDDGREVKVPVDYVQAGYLDLGYAMTVHKAQGQTFERAHFLGDATVYRELTYTAATRGRQETRFYVVAPDPGRAISESERDGAGLQEIARAIGQSRAKQLAVDVQRRVQAVQGLSRAELERRAHGLADILADARRQKGQAPGSLEELERELASAEERLAYAREEMARSGRRANRDPELRQREALEEHSVQRLRSKLAAARQDACREGAWWDRSREVLGDKVAAGVELARDEREHARAAIQAAPHQPGEHITALIGNRPDRGEVGAWDEAARRIEAYCQTYGRDATRIEAPARNASQRQQRDWQRVTDAINRSRGEADMQRTLTVPTREQARYRDPKLGRELGR